MVLRSALQEYCTHLLAKYSKYFLLQGHYTSSFLLLHSLACPWPIIFHASSSTPLNPSFPSFLSFSFPPDPASFTYPSTGHWQNAESSVWRSGRAFKGETIRGDGGIQDQRLPQDTRGMYSRTPPSSSWKSGGGEGEFHGQTPFPERVLPLSSSAFLPLCM